MIAQLGDCRIDKQIGEGGFGDVFRAWQIPLERTVALKTLRPELANKRCIVENFKSQMKMAARLYHPNIVSVYHCGCQDGTHYVVMQFVEGQTIDELLLKRGSITPSEVMNIVHQAADALDHAHRQQVIHGDINPGNILLTVDGKVYVTDFGAMELEGIRDRVVGVPEYVSPEQARGGDPVPASDIYSLGVVMYHMLCSRPPFSELETRDTLNAHISAKIPAVRGPVHKVPTRLAKLVTRMLSKNPDDRPSPSMVRDALHSISSSLKPVIIKKPKKTKRQRSRREKIAAFMMVPVFTACTAVCAMLFYSLKTEQAIDRFVKVQGASIARSRAEEERIKRVESEYSKEFINGQKLYSEKRLGLAEEAFKRASHLKPKTTDARMFLSAIYIERGQFDLAAWHLRRVLQLNPRKREASEALRFVQQKLEVSPVELIRP